jgi:radical SAM/Cys-rich protein
MSSFAERTKESTPEELQATDTEILQVNVGRKCNLECTHCHLACSPDRDEMMSRGVMEAILRALPELECSMIDITGGAPELHPDLSWFITELKQTGKSIQVRTNLVALGERDDLMSFFQNNGVQLVASMPCYMQENVDAQRGDGVYEKAVAVLLKLNTLGYGIQEALPLNLVYNPGGAFLPGAQKELEDAYRKELQERFGIQFSHLLVVTNVPVGRFREALATDGALDDYMKLLEGSFNPSTLDKLMCRHQICVDWNGALYDCDFNLALGMASKTEGTSIESATKDALAAFVNRTIATGSHCFACTAGAGSSCGGSLT